MKNLELRTFSSVNESGLSKALLLCQLPIGGTMVERVMIDEDEPCANCEHVKKLHDFSSWKYCNGKWVDYENRQHNCPCFGFSPSKWHLGLRFMIERKKGEGALCECGHRKLSHDYECENVACQEDDCECRHYNPAIFEVVGGMWHSEWVKSVMEPTTSGIMIFGQEEMKKEAAKEGFQSWQGVLDYFAKNGMDINKTWRVEYKRIG